MVLGWTALGIVLHISRKILKYWREFKEKTTIKNSRGWKIQGERFKELNASGLVKPSTQ